jgi:putative membrane protein
MRVAPAAEQGHPWKAMHLTKSTLLILSLGCMFAGGCDKSSPDTTPPEPAAAAEPTPPPADPTPASDPATEPVTGNPADAANPAETPKSDGSAPPAALPPKLTDAEIAAIVRAANNGEIELGKLAKTKAKNKRVKEFAAMMVKDHTDMNKKGDDVCKKAGIQPNDNEISAHMTDESKTTLELLKGTAKGTDFDKAYMDAQVNAHTQVLDAIDKKLMPNVQSPDLKGVLDTARPKVETHLGLAKEIQALVSPPNNPPTT